MSFEARAVDLQVENVDHSPNKMENAFNPDARLGGDLQSLDGGENVEVDSPDREKLSDDYKRELESVAACPDTLGDIRIDPDSLHEVSSAEVKTARIEFNAIKERIIDAWEQRTGQDWPRYTEDVYYTKANGERILIHKAGERYDAHHVIPLILGGENSAENITPVHALDHFDKQGIHEAGGALDNLVKSYREA